MAVVEAIETIAPRKSISCTYQGARNNAESARIE